MINNDSAVCTIDVCYVCELKAYDEYLQQNYIMDENDPLSE